MDTGDAVAERLAAQTSAVTGNPVGMAVCGCPNRLDGSPPALHLCRACGYVGSSEVHRACAGCAYLAASATG